MMAVLVPESRVLHHETLRGGSAWSRRLGRQQVLRLIDTSGSACVSALFYNADELLERYNMADTLKAQYTAFLTKGRVLFSDMGRVLASIIDDTCGWHDTISGCGDAEASRVRFGEGSYQDLRNDFHRNARDNFIVELFKHGLGKRDIVANVNFFVCIAVDGEGKMAWRASNSRPSAYVDLRFEMDTLVVLSNTPHPLDPVNRYAPPAVELVVWQGEPPGSDDPCRQSRPESGRGFALTEAYLRERLLNPKTTTLSEARR
jgi:urea carboxylase-associated protein 2